MDSKEQIILSIKRENEFLKMENMFLKNEFLKLTGTVPVFEMNKGNSSSHNNFLPPINNNKHNINFELQEKVILIIIKKLNEVDAEMNRLKDENIQLRRAKEIAERQNNNLVNENYLLSSKLLNLENVFVGSNIIKNKDGTISNEIEGNYTYSSVIRI
jgi:kinesin family member 12